MSSAYSYSCNFVTNRIITPCFVDKPLLLAGKALEVLALWDTGATCTCISEELAGRLGLVPDDVTSLRVGDNRQIPSKLYSVQIRFGNLLIPFVRVSSLPGISSSHDLIIGMDIISNGDLSVSNYKGKTMLSFRMPSLGCVDYQKDLSRFSQIHDLWVKRGNMKCPCNSGKLWDNCHGKQ